MSDSPKIAREVQKLNQDALIELYLLDLTEQGGPVTFFHNESINGEGELVFGGDTYMPIPFEARGFTSSADSQPTPTITIGNVSGFITALARDYDDLRGARIVRTRTFRKHLADGADPDGEARFSEDIFYVDRKQSENKMFAEFALGSALDVEGVQLPARRILTRCRWQFKDGVGCPYTGSDTTCDKTVQACAEKFGDNNPLPFGGFPGVSRIRLSFS
jgi:lambda family phage minor tail protein L